MNLMILVKKLRAIYLYYRRNDLRSTLNRIFSKQYRLEKNKIDILNFYDFISPKPKGPKYTDNPAPKNTINWFIPPFERGSGGHLNIFRFISLLEKLNYNCRVIVINNTPTNQAVDVAYIKQKITEWFLPLEALVYDGSQELPSSFFSMATSWGTAYPVRDFQTTQHKCYFVQDFEPYFYARGSEYAIAEATYRFGFTAITAGEWLAEKLSAQYNQKAYALSFSYDYKHYKLLTRRNPETKHIFFYARPPTPRRAFELGILALNKLLKQLPDVNVIFAGWDTSNYEIPFPHLNAGTLSIDKLPDLYNQCDIALVLSFTNLSLLPLELMACGVPVVSNRAPCTEWLLNDDNAMLTSTEPEALAHAMHSLLTDQDLHASIRKAGIATANTSSWEKEALKLSNILDLISNTSQPEETISFKNKDCCEHTHY